MTLIVSVPKLLATYLMLRLFEPLLNTKLSLIIYSVSVCRSKNIYGVGVSNLTLKRITYLKEFNTMCLTVQNSLV